MARKSAMLSAGISPLAANSITGTASTTNPAGSTQGTATPLTSSLTYTATVAASTGFILPSSLEVGDSVVVENDDSADAVLVYPPVGSEIGTGAVNAGFSVAAGKTAMFIRMTPTHFAAILSA